MNKLYNLIIWHNDTTPAVNESNLNAMSEALDNIDDRVIELGGYVLETVPEIQNLVNALEQLSQNPPYIGANGNWYVFDTNTETYVDSGVDASITITIADVTAINPDATPYVTNTGTNTDPIFHLFIPRGQPGQNGEDGADGQDGNGIVSITKTSTSGNVDTYTILYTNGTTDTFTVTNGTGGASLLSQLNDVKITLVANGDILRYNSITQKWENVALNKSTVGLGNVDNTSDLAKPVSTATQIALNAKANTTDVNNLHKVTTFQVTSPTPTDWVTDTTSQTGSTLYKKTITLNHVYAMPEVDIAAASGSTLPTTDEQAAYDLVQYVTVDAENNYLYLYASEIPENGFYIKVEGVD